MQRPYDTKQGYYDDIVARYKDGRLPAYAGHSAAAICKYLFPGTGKKCVAGLLIPGEKYSPSVEGYGVSNIKDKENIFSLPDAMSFEQLMLCQEAHDRNVPRPNEALKKIAMVLGIEPQEV